MNILLTNDDGYNSEGLQALYRSLSKDYNVYVAAPASQKSAVGHGVSLRTPMKIHHIEGGYAIEGTPADCVKVAVCGFFRDIKFDMVVSGINDGVNLGSDVFYSGTVAGAREGVINNISAIACSMDRPVSKEKFEAAAEIIRKLILHLEEIDISERYILNVNFPSSTKFKGIFLTHLGNRVYDEVICVENKEGITYATVVVDDGVTFISKEGSDTDCLHAGCVSITPMTNEFFIPSFTSKISDLVKKLEILVNGS